jgi:2-phospho-L-lactate guanylyltransferase (CobY/MobA/RfbA family)
MICAVLPVKAPRHAKQRLSAILTPEQREALARALFKRVSAALGAVRILDRIGPHPSPRIRPVSLHP